ncbi:MAG: PIN domain-containing protein, partial [Comamonas sp.]
GVMAAFDAAVEYVAPAPRIRFICTDPDDQHFLDLASQHQALLVSKDRAVLKQRKRVATHYGATVGNIVLLEEAAAEAC